MLQMPDRPARPDVAESCLTAFCGEYLFISSTFTSQHLCTEQPAAISAMGSRPNVFFLWMDMRFSPGIFKTIGKFWHALRIRTTQTNTIANGSNSKQTMLAQTKNAMKFSLDQTQPVANGTADTQEFNCGEPQTAPPPKDTFPPFDNPIFSLPPAIRQSESPETESFRQKLKAHLPQHKPSGALQQRIRDLIKKG